MIGKYMIATAGAALALLAGPASAATVFDYTGGFQSFTAATTGTYHITAAGAQGGTAYQANYLGGLGAQVGGDLTLTMGEVLTILVGGMGGFGGQGNGVIFPPSGGGGGGSFVYTTAGYVPLAVAGGGGGAGNTSTYQSAPTGGQPTGATFGNPGGYGNACDNCGGPGAGFYASPSTIFDGFGYSPQYGGGGGIDPQYAYLGPNGDGHGGFGGGGAGSPSENSGGGGGGGGFSGGDAVALNAGKGGGSYLAPGTPMNADYVDLGSVHSGNGLITINFLNLVAAVPEPASWGMMILGMGMIGTMMRRRKIVTTPVSFAA